MKAFISGGAGFIGSHLLRLLLSQARTERVVVFDNFSSGQWEYIEELVGDERLVVSNGDLKHVESVEKAMQGCETVYHLAANPDTARAVTQPDIDFWEGTYLTQNVLEAMRVTGTQNIIYTSGSGVYGEHVATAFREDFGPCTPISTYGASKLACEGLISAYSHMFGFFGRALRFANVVGPRQTHGVGYDFIRRLQSNPTRLRILGDGKQSKSYIHVEDVLRAMMAVQVDRTQRFDIYNAATDDYITVNEIAEIAALESGLDPAQVQYEYTGGDRGWKGDVPMVRFDSSKLKALDWRAERNSAEAVRDSIRAMIEEIRA